MFFGQKLNSMHIHVNHIYIYIYFGGPLGWSPPQHLWHPHWAPKNSFGEGLFLGNLEPFLPLVLLVTKSRCMPSCRWKTPAHRPGIRQAVGWRIKKKILLGSKKIIIESTGKKVGSQAQMPPGAQRDVILLPWTLRIPCRSLTYDTARNTRYGMALRNKTLEGTPSLLQWSPTCASCNSATFSS